MLLNRYKETKHSSVIVQYLKKWFAKCLFSNSIVPQFRGYLTRWKWISRDSFRIASVSGILVERLKIKLQQTYQNARDELAKGKIIIQNFQLIMQPLGVDAFKYLWKPISIRVTIKHNSESGFLQCNSVAFTVRLWHLQLQLCTWIFAKYNFSRLPWSFVLNCKLNERICKWGKKNNRKQMKKKTEKAQYLCDLCTMRIRGRLCFMVLCTFDISSCDLRCNGKQQKKREKHRNPL